jgi:transposase
VRSQCTQSKRRTLSVRRREASEALEAARQREQTEEFVQLYAQRAGIEGTHAQGVRRMGLRRSRYVGEARTHLQHMATAIAINVFRLHDWLTGVSPHCRPLSHFARFMKKIA